MTCRNNWKRNLSVYVVLLADGREFVYLALMFIQLTFRQSSINE